jgi:hypothetical protein
MSWLGNLHSGCCTLNQAQEKLYDKVRDLEKFEGAVLGRELEMIKLKRELQDTKQLLERLNRSHPSKEPCNRIAGEL